MGFLDEIKERLGFDAPQRDYYDDDYDSYGEEGSGLLGNTARPDVSSVSVYTRNGQLIDNNGADLAEDYDGYENSQEAAPYRSGDYEHYESPSTPSRMSSTKLADSSSLGSARVPSGQLPAYVLRPRSYDDAQTVVSRVKTNQPVVLSFQGTDIEAAKRIFDFCAGFAVGCGGAIEELGDRCFVVLPANVGLSQTDIDKLVHDGILSRS